jgi:hypothetical protein
MESGRWRNRQRTRPGRAAPVSWCGQGFASGDGAGERRTIAEESVRSIEEPIARSMDRAPRLREETWARTHPGRLQRAGEMSAPPGLGKHPDWSRDRAAYCEPVIPLIY